tara:strand:- start:564 stop:1325 length:762 start_codon:yes stop_codon:yes gene_type:complete
MAKKVNKKSPTRLNTKPDLSRFNMAPLAKPSPTKKVSPMKDFGITAAIAAKAVAAKAAAAAAAKAVAAAAAKALAGKTAAALGKGIASKAATALAKGAKIGKAAKLAKGAKSITGTLTRGTGKKILADVSGKSLTGKVAGKFGGKATNLVTKKAKNIVDKVAGEKLKKVSNLTKAKKFAKKAVKVGGQVKMGVDFLDSKTNKEEPAENKGMNDFANTNFNQSSTNRTGYKTPFTMKAGKGGPMRKNYPGLFKK